MYHVDVTDAYNDIIDSASHVSVNNETWHVSIWSNLWIKLYSSYDRLYSCLPFTWRLEIKG